jgi:hypothetical protein
LLPRKTHNPLKIISFTLYSSGQGNLNAWYPKGKRTLILNHGRRQRRKQDGKGRI